jgi:hypothetical protein
MRFTFTRQEIAEMHLEQCGSGAVAAAVITRYAQQRQRQRQPDQQGRPTTVLKFMGQAGDTEWERRQAQDRAWLAIDVTARRAAMELGGECSRDGQIALGRGIETRMSLANIAGQPARDPERVLDMGREEMASDAFAPYRPEPPAPVGFTPGRDAWPT